MFIHTQHKMLGGSEQNQITSISEALHNKKGERTAPHHQCWKNLVLVACRLHMIYLKCNN